jgi:hypothetical protein
MMIKLDRCNVKIEGGNSYFQLEKLFKTCDLILEDLTIDHDERNNTITLRPIIFKKADIND